MRLKDEDAEVLHAFANATGSGNTQVVPAQGMGKIIRVKAVTVVSSQAVTVKFQSGTTDISAGFPVGTNGGFALGYNRLGWFQTAKNEALNVNLSGSSVLGVQVSWARVR